MKKEAHGCFVRASQEDFLMLYLPVAVRVDLFLYFCLNKLRICMSWYDIFLLITHEYPFLGICRPFINYMRNK